MIQSPRKTKKGKPNYFYSILIISMVLFVLGMLMTFIIQANTITKDIKERLEIQVELKSDVDESKALVLRNKLALNPGFKSVDYISKEQAADQLEKELGDNFREILGYNPLYSSLKLKVNANYANVDSIELLKASLIKIEEIKEVSYQKALVDSIDRNANKFLFIMVGIGILLLVIALSLIDSTIRLAMFSNRFLIRSMQLVGATRWFIIKPFIMKGVTNGLISGLIASVGLLAFYIYLENQVSGLSLLRDLLNFVVVIGAVIGLGILISWLSTQRAVSKYLRMKLDDLY